MAGNAFHFRGDEKEVNSSKKEMTPIGHITQYGTRISTPEIVDSFGPYIFHYNTSTGHFIKL